MNKILEGIKTRKNYLQKIKKEKEDALKNAPEGKLRICCNKEKTQFYHRTNPKDFNGVYISVKNNELAQRLAQKDYDEKVLVQIEKELDATETYLQSIQKQNMEAIYENMHEERKKLVTPICKPNDEFIREWENVTYTRKEFLAETPELYSSKGERVRSKSEVIIADTLKNEKIPYRYEYPLQLKGMGIIYPDFMVLNPRTKKEMYWEHLGKMCDPDYAEQALRKLSCYMQNGIFLGEHLLITFETKKNPLNQKMIKNLIFHYLR